MRTLLVSMLLLLAPAACFAQTEEEAAGATPTTAVPMTIEDEVAMLRKRVDELSRLVEAMQSQLGDNAATSVLGAMEKRPEDQAKVGRAVQGRLNILNFTGAPTEISVNGARWTALKGRSYVLVPVGQVAVYRPGDDSPELLPRVGETWRRRQNTSDQLELTYEIY